MDMDALFKPDPKRKVKRKLDQTEVSSVQIPSNLLKRFCEHAWPESPAEYMAWITGTVQYCKKAKKELSVANGLFFPKQSGNSWSVSEGGGHPQALLQHLEESGTTVIGWIHSHPTFDAFFSSIDQHMMHSIQRELPMAYGIVVDKNQQPRCLRLSPEGMKAVETCHVHAEARNFSKRHRTHAPIPHRRYCVLSHQFAILLIPVA